MVRNKDKVANPKEEAEALVYDILPLAKKMLAEEGEFHPYGGFIRATGEIVHIAASDAGTDCPRAADLIDFMKRDFKKRAMANEIVAAAIVFDVRVSPPGEIEKSDAIQVNVEHSGSYCAEVFFPYWGSRDGELSFGNPFAQAGTRSLFVR